MTSSSANESPACSVAVDAAAAEAETVLPIASWTCVSKPSLVLLKHTHMHIHTQVTGGNIKWGVFRI